MPQRNTDPVTMDPIEPHRRVVANRQAYNVHSLAEIVHRASHRDPTFGRRAARLPHSRREITPEEAARWIFHARHTGWAPAAGARMTPQNRRVPDHLRAAAAELARRQQLERQQRTVLDAPMVNHTLYRYRGELLPAEEIRRRNPAVEMMFLSRWTPTPN